ncbi:MAG: PhoU domain-containing protein [Actinomycetota bacterium]
MVMDFFRGGADRQLEAIEAEIGRMLLDCRHTFDLAANALIGGTDPATVGGEIRATDRRVNRAERAVRKELLVHVSVRGGRADLPLVLASMSIVKDAERIGDYAKNIWDLAAAGIDWSAAPDRAALIGYRDRTSDLISDAARIFGERDPQAASSLLQKGDAMQDDHDAEVMAQLRSDGPAAEAVARALYHRYLKRVVAHTMNVLTSLVMPIHRLDYYDEKKADRD